MRSNRWLAVVHDDELARALFSTPIFERTIPCKHEQPPQFQESSLVKITHATTLGQLTFFKAKLGVQIMNVTTAGTEGTRRRALVYHAKYGYHACVADTEAEALDGAFQSLVRAIGTELEMVQL